MTATSHLMKRLDDLHSRREQGVPTVAVLVGPRGLGIRAWLEWNRAAGRSVARVDESTSTAVAWTTDLHATDALRRAAIARFAAASSVPADVATERLGRMTEYDFEAAWRELRTDTSAAAAVAARGVLERVVAGRPLDAADLVGAISSRSTAAVVQAWCELVPPVEWPALLLSGTDGTDWLAAAMKELEPLAAASPRLPVAVVVDQDAYRAYLAGPLVARHQALAREGFVPIDGVSAAELTARLDAVGLPHPPPTTLTQLTGDGLSEEAAAAFVRTARELTTRVALSDDNPAARSAAEQFLYEQLNAIPDTAGLFHLNRSLAFRHGPRPAEADLAAERLKVAIEIDGAYYHLNPANYRRDRRKDWLYQAHGYLVLRFLAEDVVEHLDAIVATVRDAVAFRRNPSLPRGDS